MFKETQIRNETYVTNQKHSSKILTADRYLFRNFEEHTRLN
jgi:hypothetical protein